MAKSLRSKTKQAFRSKKRESGIYAATEAARLDRLHAKLAATVQKQKQSDDADDLGENPEGMQISEIEKQGIFSFGRTRFFAVCLPSMRRWAKSSPSVQKDIH